MSPARDFNGGGEPALALCNPFGIVMPLDTDRSAATLKGSCWQLAANLPASARWVGSAHVDLASGPPRGHSMHV